MSATEDVVEGSLEALKKMQQLNKYIQVYCTHAASTITESYQGHVQELDNLYNNIEHDSSLKKDPKVMQRVKRLEKLKKIDVSLFNKILCGISNTFGGSNGNGHESEDSYSASSGYSRH